MNDNKGGVLNRRKGALARLQKQLDEKSYKAGDEKRIQKEIEILKSRI